ncbi:MAG: UDP-N-acetylglucosamine 2-epimerase (non-hydrolyzing) [Phaeodactylibacter sp.]|nr:UDP-N-acetylglucosamine 2-epimerase (non-hydrolyzing) [Phaeodactylibacter sp.]
MKILNIVGARPNFMKIAPLHRAFQQVDSIESKIVHTGQHYDAKMSDVFFNQLELPQPDYYLGLGGGSHTYQTARIMLKFEEVLNDEQPDLVLVVGDVNSTIATALVASKMNIKVAHVEAGLRSGDRTMPEEINRILTDSISDYLFVTEQSGMINLAKEGVPDEKVFFVGNVMIDSLIHFREKASKSTILNKLGVGAKDYVLMTMHRPHNVDQEAGLKAILQIIKDTARHKTVVFPIHPRTSNNMERFGLAEELNSIDNLILQEPLGYLEFLNLMDNAFAVITDSGGIQEETTYLQVPCLTFRDTTERPVTITLGTNVLLKDLDPATVKQHFSALLNGTSKAGVVPPLWDGKASERIAQILASI